MPKAHTHRFATPERLALKGQYWLPLKQELQRYLKKAGTGAAIALAKHLGCHSSQIHRYSCPVCEHDAEPSFSTGLAISAFLNNWRYSGEPEAPRPSNSGNRSKASRHRKGRPRLNLERKATERFHSLLVPAHILN